MSGAARGQDVRMHPLEHFVAAQDEAGTYDRAVRELRAGRKDTHWMWFVFPQLAGLGRSPMAQRYALADLAHARAYLDHPVLGPRLRECAGLLDAEPDTVLGQVDAMKLRSSMTLFALAAPEEPLFQQVLDRWYGGQGDPLTLAQASSSSSRS